MTELDILWVVVCAGLVFIMQAGFTCLESGLTRSKNSINVAIKNIADFGFSACLFWAFGFALMYGATFHGLFGRSNLFVALESDNTTQTAQFLFQLMFCGTAVTIVSGALAERTRFTGYLLTVLLLSGLIYPVFGHWVANGKLLGQPGWLHDLGFVDFAGSTMVHSVGGWVALSAVLIVGPRDGRFPENGPARRIPGSNLPMAVLGTLLLWFGWLGFNGGSTGRFGPEIPAIIAKTVLAGAAGLVTSMAMARFLRRPGDVYLLINGSLAGLVAITASCDVVSAPAAFVIGSVGAMVMAVVDRLLERARVDDVVGAIAVHAGAGVWGTLAVGLFGRPGDLLTGLAWYQQFAVQLLGVVTCCIWTMTISLSFLWLVNRYFPLRVTPKQERDGLNVSEHGATTELFELSKALERQAVSGDIRLRAPVEPFTEVGRIAALYNTVLEALEQAEERFRESVIGAPNAMLLVNQDGYIVLANSQAETLFGYEREELLGQTVNVLIPTSLRAAHDSHVQSYFADPQSRLMNANRELVGLRKNGQKIPLEIGLSPIYTDKETLVVTSMIDITRRKQAEDALREARDAAEKANRAKSEFVAHMSHEIRTPMNGVVGMLELLRNTEISHRQQEYIHLAKESAQSLLRILNDILDFSKIEAGKLELESSAFSIRRLLGDTLQSLEANASEKHLELACSVDPELTDVLVGDPGRLRQIIVNLVGNALKFTQQGEVVVRVAKHSVTDTEATIRVSVRDTGIGIPPAQQRRIFEPFDQADRGISRQFGGTGLGLTISRQLISLMHGQMQLESEPGRGTTFVFTATFQRPHPSNARETLPPEQDSVGVPTAPKCAGARVLLVDDNETNGRILRDLLLFWKADVLVSTGGKSAIEMLETRAAEGQLIELAIIDAALPDTDGWQLARQIRRRDGLQVLPVIMLLSFAANPPPDDVQADREDDGSEGPAVAFTGTVNKPVNPLELAEQINAALAGVVRVPRDTPEPQSSPADRSLRILLAEDGVVNQKVAAGLLEAQGHVVDIAANGFEAVQATRQTRFDLVLMDIQMPEMDGIQATAEIRAAERGKLERVPIIALTAHAIKGDREHFLAAGMDEHISKPIDPAVLHETIRRLTLTVAGGQADTETADTETGDTRAAGAPAAGLPTAMPKTSGDTALAESDLNSVIDIEHAKERIPGGTATLQEVARLLHNEAPRLLECIQEASAEGDATRLQREAHTLKSSADIFGAAAVAKHAKHIENLAEEGEIADAISVIDDLAGEVQRLSAALAVIIDDDPGQTL